MDNEKARIIPVILCGGMGSRLWPLSRQQHPKQFLALAGNNYSLLQNTLLRLQESPVAMMRPVIVTNEEHRFLVAEHLRQINVQADIILEPEGRNTAPAIAAAALHIKQSYGDALMLVLPSDHIIKNNQAFLDAVDCAQTAAVNGQLVTFGITPEYAETGYGYIKKGLGLADQALYHVAAFVEKPDAATAQSYFISGEYLWNSGMFMFRATTYLEELGLYRGDILAHVVLALANGFADRDFIRLSTEDFSRAYATSIDYAVMEHTDKAVTIPLSCGWNDAGAWDALWRIHDKDADENVTSGMVIARECSSNYIHAEPGRAVAALGVEDLVIISTDDMVMVASQSHAQSVKQLMEEASARLPESVAHHTRVHRPWGYYEQMSLGERHKVKHIQVNPGEKLSLQKHMHRAEHWVIISGTAKVQCGGETRIMSENEHIHIPLGEVHCMENIGKIPLDVVEVQYGAYLGEDDIIRLEDRYGRTGYAQPGGVPKLVEKSITQVASIA